MSSHATDLAVYAAIFYFYRVAQNTAEHFILIFILVQCRPTSHKCAEKAEGLSNILTVVIQIIKKVLNITVLHCSDRG